LGELFLSGSDHQIIRDSKAIVRPYVTGQSRSGPVLVAASRLDGVLKGVLLAYLRDTKPASDLRDGFNAPLGIFSARACVSCDGPDRRR
jgi:phosphoketolase